MKLLLGADLHGLEEAYRRFGEILSLGEFDVGVLAGDLMGYPSEQDLDWARAGAGSRQGPDAAPTAPTAPPAPAAPATDGEDVLERALLHLQARLKSLLSGAGKPVVFVMGNDDGILGRGLPWSSEGLFVDIHMRRARHGTYNFVGYHHTSPFVGGTFEKSLEDQEADFRSLQRLVDARTILVTHGPPLGTLDRALDGKQVGSSALGDFVKRARPMMHLFGHIHRTFGQEGVSVNGAYPLHRQFMAVDVEQARAEPVG